MTWNAFLGELGEAPLSVVHCGVCSATGHPARSPSVATGKVNTEGRALCRPSAAVLD